MWTRISDQPKVSCHELRRGESTGRLPSEACKNHVELLRDYVEEWKKGVEKLYQKIARILLAAFLSTGKLVHLPGTDDRCAISSVGRIVGER